MTSQRCPRCGRRYPSSYRRCPYCSGQRRDEQRRRPASPLSQILEYLRRNSSRIFVGGAAFFLCVAILGMLLTQCGKPKEEAEQPDPAPTEDPVKQPLAIAPTAASLEIGETASLTVSGDYDSLTWTSSDEAVASVESGRVTAKAAGTARITASAGEESVSCTVTVKEPPPVSRPELALNHTDFTIRPGDPTPVQMKVRIKGTKEAYTGEVVWASQDPSVVTVSETGAVEKVGRGTTVITASAEEQVLECIVRVR